jgi:flagellar protein FlaG
MCSDFATGGVDRPPNNNIKNDPPVTVKKIQEASATLSSTEKNIQQEQQAISTVHKTTEITDRVQEIEEYVQSVQRDLAFSVDDETGETVIKVYDTATEELVRQIPSEVMLKLRKAYGDNVGMLFDDKA